jgi:hypothetical protein
MKYSSTGTLSHTIHQIKDLLIANDALFFAWGFAIFPDAKQRGDSE